AMPQREPRALIREEFPDVHVSLSSEVLPRIREWPRLSTALLNAYLEPVIVHYVDHLNRGLDAAGLRTQERFLMQSNRRLLTAFCQRNILAPQDPRSPPPPY